MTSSFAAQLSRIAATSTHELDTRARRSLHSQSLLFPQDLAAKQDFETIYTICYEGFRDLCQLDGRFTEFERNLFSSQAKDQDRDLMNKAENEALDGVIERFLRLLGGRVLLNPGLRALEWLVRRFRAHAYNSAAVILTILPYHEVPVWRTVISVIPADNLVAEWKWIAPYKSGALNVPRHTVVYAATHNDGFWRRFGQHTIHVAQDGFMYDQILNFWTAISLEAVLDRLAASRSGRKELQRQKMEDTLLKILPVLSDGYEVKNCPQLTTALFAVTMVLAAKAELDDAVLDSLLHTVATASQTLKADQQSAIITMLAIAEQKHERSVPRAVVDCFVHMPDLQSSFSILSRSYSIGPLLQALVRGALSTFKKKTIGPRIDFIEQLVRISGALSQQASLKSSIQAIFTTALKLNAIDEYQGLLRTGLVAMLNRLNEDDSLSHSIAKASESFDEQRSQLEALMGTTLAIEAITEPENIMEIDTSFASQNPVDGAIEAIPVHATGFSSFLAIKDNPLLGQLVTCFAICCQSDSALAKFVTLPIWSSGGSKNLLLLTFLIRVGLGPYPNSQRANAISLLSRQAREVKNVDMQGFLPYALALLADPFTAIRRFASDFVLALDAALPTGEPGPQLGQKDFYEQSALRLVSWIPSDHVGNIIRQVLQPSLEECILDSSFISKIIESALGSASSTIPEGMKIHQLDLKKALRNSLFQALTTHLIATPMFRVKVSLLQMLHTIHKVGSIPTSKALSPVLNNWAGLSEDEVRAIATAESLDLHTIDMAMTSLVSASDREAVDYFLDHLKETNTNMRSSLVSAFFVRLQSVWKSLKHDVQIFSALKIFNLCFHQNRAISSEARRSLRAFDLSTQALGSVLEQEAGIAETQLEGQQPRKRRRTSHGRDLLPPDLLHALESATSRLTLALELVESSHVERRVELAPLLFNVLAFLKRLNQQQRFDSPYVLNLCLSTILGIIDGQKMLSRSTIDFASIRADLVTDCIRSSDNQQVQNTALLLCASLASLAPDKMLHEVMPIFTFMGQSMFSKEDDHSVHVINQAIDEIIPALVISLKRQNKDVIRSTSGILSSFAAAFNHIPQSRRVSVYQRLLDRMGFEDFAFVLISMLAVRNRDRQHLTSFIDDLISRFSAYEQLVTYRKSTSLMDELSNTESQLVTDVMDLNARDGDDDTMRKHQSVSNMAIQILRSKSLKAAMSRMHKLKSEVSGPLRTELNLCLHQILVTIKNRRQANLDTEAAKQCLDALLALPSLSELISLLPEVLDGMTAEPDLKPQVLRVLASQLGGQPSKDSTTRAAAINLLSQLTETLQSDVDSSMKQAILVCIDRLCEVYGRKDIDAVISAATAVTGEACLGSGDSRLKIMSLLGLASMMEVLGESSAPIIPTLTSNVITILKSTIQTQDSETHNAAFALISSVVSHVPFLITDDVLTDSLELSSESAVKYSDGSVAESRNEALSVIARKIDFTSLLNALLGKDLHKSLEDPQQAQYEKLELLSIALDTASKANVIKDADLVSQLLLAHLDQRRRLSVTGVDTAETISKVETSIEKVTIQFIYKLNDAVFRPIFETWIDWATSAYDLPDEARVPEAKALRQISLFKLLTHFFSTLKSIVTSYAGYLIERASEILSNVALAVSSLSKTEFSAMQLDHYTALLTLLTTAFTHDADAFFVSPSHFNPIGPALVSQLQLASAKPYRHLVYSHIIPSIVALSISTIDTASHHQTIAHHLVQLRHHSSSAVRLASIKTLAALSSDEALGDDFVANTIGVGSATGAAGIDTAEDGTLARPTVTIGGSSAGELMIYVNEMLEDDDEDVEREVRKWVQSVRERVGEDVFEV